MNGEDCKTCKYCVSFEYVTHKGLYRRFRRWCEKGREEFPHGCDEHESEEEKCSRQANL
jgi:hypothetical protein